MALVHDLAEALAGDITPFCPVTRAEKRQRESEALKQMCALLPTAAAVSPNEGQSCSACACWGSPAAGSSSSSTCQGLPPSAECASSSAAADSGSNRSCDESLCSSRGASDACYSNRELGSCPPSSTESSNTVGNAGPSIDSTGHGSNSNGTEVKGAAAEILSLWEEYEAGETTEAKFVFDIDKFEMILQAYEYEAEAYRNQTLLVKGSKRVRAHECHSKGTTAAHDESRPDHQRDLHKQTDTQQHKQATPRQQRSAPEQQQRVLENGHPVPQAPQLQQEEATAQQQPQFQSHEPADDQQQRPQPRRRLGQADEPHPQSPQQQHPVQLSPVQQLDSGDTGQTQQGLRLSSFFNTTEGVFRSALFQTLDALLRDRRRRLHCTHAPQQNSSSNTSGSRKSSDCALPV